MIQTRTQKVKSYINTGLRKTERFTGTDMVYLVGQSGWLLVGQAAIFASSLGLAWVFANYISPSDYGLYKYVVAIATLATITTLTGFGVAITKAVAENHTVVLQKILKIQIRFGLLGAVGLLGLALYYLTKDNVLLASLLAVSALWIPFFEPFSNYQFILQGKKDFKTQTLIRIIQRVVLTALVIGTIFYTKNIIVITGVYFAALTLTQLGALLATVKKYPSTDDATTPYQTITSYAKRLSVQNIFFIGVGHIDKILLFKILGPTQLAVYYFAISLPNEVQGIIGNINSVVFPKLVDKKGRVFKTAFLKKITLFTVLLIIPVSAYIVIAPYLFAWLFPVYTDAILISQLYVGTILFTPTSLLWHYFYATDHKTALWVEMVVGPGSLILGIICLTPLYGLVGAVMAVYLRGVIDMSIGLYYFLRTPEHEKQ